MFTNRNDPEYHADPGKVILSLAAECNLDRMNKDSAWAEVGHRPKDFVRKLLVLDENQRLTAEEALQHRWFTNRKHRLLFESIYEKSIRDWQPRSKNSNIIEDLDAIMAESPTALSVTSAENLVSPSTISPFLAPPQARAKESLVGKSSIQSLSTIREVSEDGIRTEDGACPQHHEKALNSRGSQQACAPSLAYEAPLEDLALSGPTFDPCEANTSDVSDPQGAKENLFSLPPLSLPLAADVSTPTTQNKERRMMSHVDFPAKPSQSNLSLLGLPFEESDLPEPPYVPTQDLQRPIERRQWT